MEQTTLFQTTQESRQRRPSPDPLSLPGFSEAKAHLEELVAAGRIPYFNRNYVAPRLTEMKQMGILKTVGRRKATRSDATEAVWARVESAAYADRQAADPADNPTEQMTLLGPGA